MDSINNGCAEDALMLNLTSGQDWLGQMYKSKKNSRGPDPLQPTILANDIDGAFKCVVHQQLISILTHYRFPTRLVSTIAVFNMNRTIAMSLNPQEAGPAPFASGLSQVLRRVRCMIAIPRDTGAGTGKRGMWSKGYRGLWPVELEARNLNSIKK